LVIGSDRASAHERLFVWHGFVLTSADVAGRLTWCAVAFAIVCIASLLFDRFASNVSSSRERAPKAWRTNASNAFARTFAPVLDVVFAGDFGALVLAELRLMLKGSSVWWYAVAAGLWIATLVSPLSQQSIVLGLAWLWPILTWSQMGTRESLNDTEGFVFPSLHPLRRQFAATWIAGILLALFTGSGALMHCGFAANWPAFFAIVIGAVFIPTLALACGAASGTSRLFEIVYLVVWYVGPMNATKGVDFTSVSAVGPAAVASVILAVLAFAARRTRLQQA
jgi:hypothetical protein